MKVLLAVLVLFYCLPTWASDSSDAPMRIGGPYYFGTISAKLLPETPRGQLTEQQAKNPRRTSTYYVAYFNDQGKLISLEKILGQRSLGKSIYQYDAAGRVVAGQLTEPDGPILNYQADSKGNLQRVQK